MTNGSVFLIVGSPGSGKSTSAYALLQHFPFGIHLPVDDLRELVVSGIAQPIPKWTDETARQYHLARAGTAILAQTYSKQGFAVAIDDVFTMEVVEEFRELCGETQLHVIVLVPPEGVALARSESRGTKNFDPTLLQGPIHRCTKAAVEWVDPTRTALKLDNSDQTVQQSVEAILGHFESL